MLELPSIPNVVLSTIVFFVAVWYLHRRLDEYDMPKGMTRSMLVVTLATVVSVAAGTVADGVFNKGRDAPQVAHATVGVQPVQDSPAEE